LRHIIEKIYFKFYKKNKLDYYNLFSKKINPGLILSFYLPKKQNQTLKKNKNKIKVDKNRLKDI